MIGVMHAESTSDRIQSDRKTETIDFDVFKGLVLCQIFGSLDLTCWSLLSQF